MKQKVLCLLISFAVGVANLFAAADLLDVRFNQNASATDISGRNMTVVNKNNAGTYYNPIYKCYAANFRPVWNSGSNTFWGQSPTGHYSINYNSDQTFKDGLSNGHTIEVLISGSIDRFASEAKPFASQAAGGTGIVVSSDGKLSFLPHVGGGYRWAQDNNLYQKNKYYHLVGVWDKSAGTVTLYVDGVKKGVVNQTGNFTMANANPLTFIIGGDCDGSGNGTEAGWPGDVVFARIYRGAKSDSDVTTLWNAISHNTSTSLVSGVSYPTSENTRVFPGREFTINATGYQSGDKIIMCEVGNTGKTYELAVASSKITLPADLQGGRYKFFLKRGETYQDLGDRVLKVADLLSVKFGPNGEAADVSARNMSVEKSGNNTTYWNKALNCYAANFHSAPWSSTPTDYYKINYNDDTEFKDALANGHSIELLVASNCEALDSEVKPFASHAAGGTGVLVTNKSRGSRLTFLPHVGGDWRWASDNKRFEAHKYYHLVGVWDKEAGKAYIYIDGVKAGEVAASGDFRLPQIDSGKPLSFIIGGDLRSDGNAELGWNGDVVYARIYNGTLSATDVTSLYNASPKNKTWISNVGFMSEEIKMKANYNFLIYGNGYLDTDKIVMQEVGGNSEYTLDLTVYENRAAKIKLPSDLKATHYKFYLKRGSEYQDLGCFKFTLATQATLPFNAKSIAHRGWHQYGNDCDENSRASLRNAFKAGFYGCETDVWITTDGKVMIHHNGENGSGTRIDGSTYAQVKDWSIGFEKIPTLEEYLTIMRDEYPNSPTKLIVEIKSHNTYENSRRCTQATIDMINTFGMQDRVEYIAFDYNVCKYIHQQLPNAKVAYLSGDKSPSSMKADGITGIDYNTMDSHTDWYSNAHNNGMTVNVWTINEVADQIKYATAGADYITTNNPWPVQTMYDYSQINPISGKYVYAYDLRKRDANSHWVFSYKVNDVCASGQLIIKKKSDGSMVKTCNLTSFKIGQDNEISVAKRDLANNTEYTWSITVNGGPVPQQFTHCNSLGSHSNRRTTVYDISRSAIVVDKSPESPYFGSIYMNSYNGESSSWINTFHQNGVNTFSHHAVQVGDGIQEVVGIDLDYEGFLYFCSAVNDASKNGLYQMDMDKLYNSQYGVNARPISSTLVKSFSFAGTGANQYLYIIAGALTQSNPSGTVYRYKPGQIGKLGSGGNFGNGTALSPQNYRQDGRVTAAPNGFWLTNPRSYTTDGGTLTVIRYFDTNGNLIKSFTEKPSGYAGIAFNKDYTHGYHVNMDNDWYFSEIYSRGITWSGNTPSMTSQTITRPQSKTPHQMSVDYAGNVWVFDGDVYLLTEASDVNTCNTPCRTAEEFTNSFIENFPEHLYIYGNVLGESYESLRFDTTYECYNAGDGVYYTTVTNVTDTPVYFNFSSNPTDHGTERYGSRTDEEVNLAEGTADVYSMIYAGSESLNHSYRLMSKGVYYVEIDMKKGTTTLSRRKYAVDSNPRPDYDVFSPKVLYVLCSDPEDGGFDTSDRSKMLAYDKDTKLVSGVVFIPKNSATADHARVILTSVPGTLANKANWDCVKYDRFSCENSNTDGIQYKDLVNNVVTTPLKCTKETYWGIRGSNPEGYYRISANFNDEAINGIPAHSIRFEKVNDEYPEHLYVYGNVGGYTDGDLHNTEKFECYNAGNGKYYTTITKVGNGQGDFEFASDSDNYDEHRWGPKVEYNFNGDAEQSSKIYSKGAITNRYHLTEEGIYYVEIDLATNSISIQKRQTACGAADYDTYSPKVVYVIDEETSGYNTEDRSRVLAYRPETGLVSGIVYMNETAREKKPIVFALTSTPGKTWDVVKYDRYADHRTSNSGEYTLRTLDSTGKMQYGFVSSIEPCWRVTTQSGTNTAGYYKISMNFTMQEREGVPAHQISIEKLDDNKVYLVAGSGCAFQNYDGAKFTELAWGMNYLQMDKEKAEVKAPNTTFCILDHGTLVKYIDSSCDNNITNKPRFINKNSGEPITVDAGKKYNCIVYNAYIRQPDLPYPTIAARAYDGIDYTATTVKQEPNPTSSSSYLLTQPEVISWNNHDNAYQVRVYAFDENGKQIFYKNFGAPVPSSISLYGLYNNGAKYATIEHLYATGGSDNMRDIVNVEFTGTPDKLDEAYFQNKFQGANLRLADVNGKNIFDQQKTPGLFGANVCWDVNGSIYPAYYNIYYIDRNAHPSGPSGYEEYLQVCGYEDNDGLYIPARNNDGSVLKEFVSSYQTPGDVGFALTTQWEFGATTPFSDGNPVTIDYIIRPKFLVYNPSTITNEISVPYKAQPQQASLQNARVKAAGDAWTDFTQLPAGDKVLYLDNVSRVSSNDLVLRVDYTNYDPETSVEAVLGNSAKVYGSQGEIVLEGVTGKVTVVTETGAVKAVVPMASGDRFTIPQPAGIYLVIFNNRAEKVKVK